MEEQPNRTDDVDRTVVDEMRELGQSLSALGKTAFKGGRVLSVELLRTVREVVDKARDEIDRWLVHPRPGARSADHADQPFGLENAEGLAQGRARNPQAFDQLPLGGEEIAFGNITVDDLGADLVGDDFACLGNAYPRARCVAIAERHGLSPLPGSPEPGKHSQLGFITKAESSDAAQTPKRSPSLSVQRPSLPRTDSCA